MNFFAKSMKDIFLSNETRIDGASGTKSPEMGDVIANIVSIAMYFVGALAIIMIILGGIMYATAAGNDDKIKKARKMIVGAVIGLAVAILAYVLVDFFIKNL